MTETNDTVLAQAEAELGSTFLPVLRSQSEALDAAGGRAPRQGDPILLSGEHATGLGGTAVGKRPTGLASIAETWSAAAY